MSTNSNNSSNHSWSNAFESLLLMMVGTILTATGNQITASTQAQTPITLLLIGMTISGTAWNFVTTHKWQEIALLKQLLPPQFGPIIDTLAKGSSGNVPIATTTTTTVVSGDNTGAASGISNVKVSDITAPQPAFNNGGSEVKIN